MANPCDFYIHGKKMKMEQFLSYIKNMPHNELNEILGGIPSFKNIPAAPFVTSTPAWVKLGFKVAIKEAVNQGATKIAWTTGEQQNERYDLSKSVDDIYTSEYSDVWVGSKYEKRKDVEITLKGGETKKFVVDEIGKVVSGDYTGERLDNIVGKDIAEKLLAINEDVNLSGDGLKVGGSGMKGFYDNIVPKEAKAVVKELTGQEGVVGEVELQTTSTGIESQDRVFRFRDWVWKNKTEDFSYSDAQKDVDSNSKLYQEYQENIPTQQSIEITPEIKKAVKSGMPQFQAPDTFSQEEISRAKKVYDKTKNMEKFKESLSQTEKGRDLLNRGIVDEIGKLIAEEIKSAPKKSVKRVSTALVNSEQLTQRAKEIIEENGLERDVLSHKDAKATADAIIASEGVDGALEMAKANAVTGSVRAFIYGAATEHYSDLAEKQTDPQMKEAYAQKAADIASEFEADSTEYGRFISAIGEFYKNSPLVIKKKAINSLRKRAKEMLEKQMKPKNTSVKKAQAAFNSAKKAFNIKSPKLNIRNNSKESILQQWKDSLSKGQRQLSEYTDEQIELIKDMAAIVFSEGKLSFQSFSKEMKKQMGLSDSDINELYYKTKMEGIDPMSRTLSDIYKETFPDEYLKEQEAILNKYFPDRTGTEVNRKQKHQKIIEQYNAGVLNTDKKNKAGVPFAELFYEKLGIADPNNPEVQKKIGEFAEKMSKVPEGSRMWKQTNVAMLDYLADLQYKNMLASGYSKVMAMWYANILSSPATHLRNFQYNIIQAAVLNPLVLAEKAMIKGDFNGALSALSRMFNGYSRGMVEFKKAMTDGQLTNLDEVSSNAELERGSKIWRAFAVPGRALKASDAVFTNKSYEDKLLEIAREIVKKNNPNATSEEIARKSTEMVYGTKAEMDAANEQATNEVKEWLGKDFNKDKDANMIKVRAYEIIENNRNAELQEEANERDALLWAKKGTLTNKPTGVYGGISDFIQGMNNSLFFTKFFMPFVNVPLNLTQRLVDHSPIGVIKVIRGKEGFGQNAVELTPDQRFELMLRVINYTVGAAAIAMLSGDDDDDNFFVTGSMAGDYLDNKAIEKATGIKPYTVYLFGKEIFSYKMTPLVPLLLPAGDLRDFKKYRKKDSEGDEKTMADKAIEYFYDYIGFVLEGSTMKGMSDFFEIAKTVKSEKGGADKIKKWAAGMANAFVPYSSAVKFLNKQQKAFKEENAKRATEWYEYAYKDLPVLGEYLSDRKDHFGQPVKEDVNIPFLSIGNRGWISKVGDLSKYYKLTEEKNYKVKFLSKKDVDVDGEATRITPSQLSEINAKRGEIVAKALDSKNIIFDIDEYGEEVGVSKGTTYDYLKDLSDEEFKIYMDKIYASATTLAKIEVLGSKAGITKTDIKNYQRRLKKAMDEYGLSEKDVELFKEDGFIPKPKVEKNEELYNSYINNGLKIKLMED